MPTSLCATYVKIGLAAAGFTNGYLVTTSSGAQDMGKDFEASGFKNIIGDLYGKKDTINNSDIPEGAVIIYKGGDYGHIEIYIKEAFWSDYVRSYGRTTMFNDESKTLPIKGRPDAKGNLPSIPNLREVIGVYVK
jgi:hypothetical protein